MRIIGDWWQLTQYQYLASSQPIAKYLNQSIDKFSLVARGDWHSGGQDIEKGIKVFYNLQFAVTVDKYSMTIEFYIDIIYYRPYHLNRHYFNDCFW